MSDPRMLAVGAGLFGVFEARVTRAVEIREGVTFAGDVAASQLTRLGVGAAGRLAWSCLVKAVCLGDSHRFRADCVVQWDKGVAVGGGGGCTGRIGLADHHFGDSVVRIAGLGSLVLFLYDMREFPSQLIA